MKFLERLRPRARAAASESLEQPLAQWPPPLDDIPRYPPFMLGLPAADPVALVAEHHDLLGQIQASSRMDEQTFSDLYRPLIQRFAEFVHLLPASENHHHKGAGGLLRHSLEVGLWTLRSADDHMVRGLNLTPEQQRNMIARWNYAAFVAGLCHDIGKAATDTIITDKPGERQWSPTRESLWQWLSRERIPRYYLRWRPGRDRSHVALSVLLLHQVLPDGALEWLTDGPIEVLIWLLGSLSGNGGPENQLHQHVMLGDQLSVARDSQGMKDIMAGYEFGMPVERELGKIMRNLVRTGQWSVNTRGSRVWVVGGRVFLAWPGAGEDICGVLEGDDIPNIPRGVGGLLDTMIEQNIALLDNGEFFDVYPALLTTKDGVLLRLRCVELRSDALLSTTGLPSTPGHVGNQRPAPVKATPPSAAAPTAAQTPTDGGAEGGAEKRNAANTAPRESGIPSAPKNTEAKPSGEEQQDPEAPALTAQDNFARSMLWGLVEDLNAGEGKAWGEHALPAVDGSFLVAWPGGFAGYGSNPEEIQAALLTSGVCQQRPGSGPARLALLAVDDSPARYIRVLPAMAQELFKRYGTPPDGIAHVDLGREPQRPLDLG